MSLLRTASPIKINHYLKYYFPSFPIFCSNKIAIINTSLSISISQRRIRDPKIDFFIYFQFEKEEKKKVDVCVWSVQAIGQFVAHFRKDQLKKSFFQFTNWWVDIWWISILSTQFFTCKLFFSRTNIEMHLSFINVLIINRCVHSVRTVPIIKILFI